MSDISSKLVAANVRSSVPPFWADFWPEGSLSDVITEYTIQLIGIHDEGIKQFILQRAVKLLAICLTARVRKPQLKRMMVIFRRRGLEDKCLPVSEQFMNERFKDLPWYDDMEKMDFLKIQWKFIAPKFPLKPTSSSIPQLADSIVLPFMNVEPLPQSEQGNYSTVYKVTVARSHLIPNPHPNHQDACQFALKEINIKPSQSPSAKATRKASEKEWKAFMYIMANKTKGHPRLNHLVEVKAVFDQHWKRYFMIPWASGRSLRQLLMNHHRIHNQAPGELVKLAFTQLLGITEALDRLHYYNCRHGDLKPENILIFKDDRQARLGTWKIADLGLAKIHLDPTARRGATSTMCGTISYEAPEFLEAIHSRGPISRLFDVWSMGCIMLQLITWLLYDSQGVEELAKKTWNHHRQASTFWIEKQFPNGARGRQVIHAVVQNQMATILDNRAGSQAIKDLIRVVKDKLLVIDTPTNSTGPSPPGTRINSNALVNELRQICGRGARDERYWYASGPLVQTSAHLMLTAPASFNQRQNEPTVSVLKPALSEEVIAMRWSTDSKPQLNEEWTFTVDNDFAQRVISDDTISGFVPRNAWPESSMKICGKCQALDFLLPNFQIEDRIQELERKAKLCEFCSMRWNTCKHLMSRNVSAIYFERFGSNLRLNGTYPPVLALRIGPGTIATDEAMMSQLQVGLPRLSEVGQPFYFRILRNWLHDCDENHADCKPGELSTKTLPTRLLDVWPRTSAYVKLHETKEDQKLQYLALSHPWGDPPHFCTSSENIEQHRKGIKLKELPKTFRDAVRVTRNLGFRYLWIDSLCIVQGREGDFDVEGKRMEAIFSNANCVLAASGATGQRDGFLRSGTPRAQRTSVGIDRPGRSMIYVCEFMDDYGEHVLGSLLSQRGWVFQERILARRTIYFTNKQCYWECGSGVRCESMAKMQNKLVSYFGDPNFPRLAKEASHGAKIRLCQDLYSKYTRLAFTWDTDRSIAISGLEKRLIDSLMLSGGFGILDGEGPGFLRRSLLWCRAVDTERLDKIIFQSTGGSILKVPQPPSWSWMAYKGPIQYMSLPLGGIDWEEDDVRSPWSGQPARTWNYSRDISSHGLAIPITPRGFDRLAAPSTGITLDRPFDDTHISPNVKCVILGKIKVDTHELQEEGDHFMLLVQPDASSDLHGPQVYHRIGVARMPGSLIEKDGLGIPGLLR